MKTLRYILAALALCLLPVSAQAACYYYTTGAGGNWSATGNWYAGTGGTGGPCAASGGYPHSSGDTGLLNAASGGGTVTIDVDLTILVMDISGFTGTLSDTAHNVTFAAYFYCTSGSSATLSLGTVTWTFTSNSTVFNDNGTCLSSVTATAATFTFAPTTITSQSISLGNHHYGTLNLNTASTSGYNYNFVNVGGTIDTLNLNATPIYVTFPTSTTWTFTNPWNFTGSASQPIYIAGNSTNSGAGQTVFNLGGTTRCTYCAFWNMKINGGSLTATNSFNLGFLTTSGTGAISITGPSGGGGGGYIIGGQ